VKKAALALSALAFVLAGCSHHKTLPGPKTTGVNEKPVQPTTGTNGTKAPTPPSARTTTTAG